MNADRTRWTTVRVPQWTRSKSPETPLDRCTRREEARVHHSHLFRLAGYRLCFLLRTRSQVTTPADSSIVNESAIPLSPRRDDGCALRESARIGSVKMNTSPVAPARPVRFLLQYSSVALRLAREMWSFRKNGTDTAGGVRRGWVEGVSNGGALSVKGDLTDRWVVGCGTPGGTSTPPAIRSGPWVPFSVPVPQLCAGDRRPEQTERGRPSRHNSLVTGSIRVAAANV